MKSLNTYYTDFVTLESFIRKNKIQNSKALLIQIFTSYTERKIIEEILENVSHPLPDAVIIGSTTDGEIMQGKVSAQQTVLSFSMFEQTTLKTHSVKHQVDGYFSGKIIAESLIEKDTKLLIAFTDGLHTNGDAFLKGINDVSSEVIVAGGLAGDNAAFKTTYVFTKDEIISEGAVAVSLNSKHLDVFTDYSFNWRRIGKPLTITKVVDNRVYIIDNRTAVETYMHYLGESMAEGLPAVGIEFPLISVRGGLNVARAVLAKHDDGSLSFAGNFKKGDKVQFGYGDPQEILKFSQNILNTVSQHAPEAIFIYSCMARRHFMPEVIESETHPLNDVAPVAGFFTYGEFFTSSSSKKELLNQTMTLVTLSENSKNSDKKKPIKEKPTLSNSSTNALIHLVNITSAEAMEQEVLLKAQTLFEKLFQSSPDGILLMENDKFVQCNQKMLDIFGYTIEEHFLNARPLAIAPRKQPDGSHSVLKIKEMKKLAIEKGNHRYEWVYKKENGTHFWADVMLTSLELNGRHMIYVVCRDISARKETEIELERQKNVLFYKANHDELTGLPNREFFMNEFKKGLADSKQNHNELALMFIDLDRFKNINDSLGHNIGDEVIRLVGNRLKLIVSRDDMLARLGGDEFLFLLKNIKTHDDISDKVEKILRIIKEPIVIEHYTLYTSASIGISRYPIDDVNAENILKYADTAMYKAKEEGGNNYQLYSKEMTDIAYEHVMMERDLRESIINGDFEVYYQPQVNVKIGEIVGVEALVRWNHPTVGILTPDIFIPLSEKTGVIVELDLWVMKQAMKDVSGWYQEGLNPGKLSLNVSMKQLEYPHLGEEIDANVKMFDFHYEWLELEITETEVMKNPEKVIKILDGLHTLGISIAIDDFGTGYSSLSHLKRLPIDKLKIDKSFISDIPEDDAAIAIVNTILVLARSLNLDVIAEGVETQVQQNFLLEQGCDKIQGYYYSKPVKAEEIRKLLLP